MGKLAEKRLDERQIIDKILAEVEKNGNILEKTVEILKGVNHYTWVGIYLIEGEELVLTHFLGKPTEHTRIKLGQGICGAAVVDKKTIIVPDVKSDERYIACSAETESEIVVPIWSVDRIIGEIDIDSDYPCAFDEEDMKLLEMVADILGDVID
ncbi:MAG: GAF domain-containing protein [Thermoplasmata archaeon]|nr:MAG: GAF domain-containing protein [Thermoplasmata archaeon]